MKETPLSSSESKKKPGEFSHKTQQLIQAFSLSVGLIVSGNIFAGEQNSFGSQEVIQISQNNQTHQMYKELEYLFIEKQSGLIKAIIAKSQEDGIYEENFQSDLDFLEQQIVKIFTKSIEKNGTSISRLLTGQLVQLLQPLKGVLQLFMDLRYGKGTYNIFDGNDYSQYTLNIKFKKVGEQYIIESLYIISPIEENKKPKEASHTIFYDIT